MRNDFTDVTMVVDRSGSMDDIRLDAQGGINAFVQDQAKLPGECRITLVQFDNEYEFLHRGVLAQEWPGYELVPRGSTALFDAVGRAIVETGARLAEMPEDQRPGLVIFVISTDGMENSSRFYQGAKIREMIAHQKSVYNWQFTFLAANQDAFNEALNMGLTPDDAVEFGSDKAYSASLVTSRKVARMRMELRRGAPVSNLFTDEERKEME